MDCRIGHVTGLVAALPIVHPLLRDSMRDCHVESVTDLEKSFAEDRPRALIQTASGAGKAYSVCAFTQHALRAFRLAESAVVTRL